MSTRPETVAQAVATLEHLYATCTSATVSYAQIDAVIGQVAMAIGLDLAALKAVARGFGVVWGLTSRRQVLERIGKRIKDRKASHLCSLAILEPLK